MSTPPRKGKKRAPPSTPTGRPPAKASRPSSPLEYIGGFSPALHAEAEDIRRRNPGITPDIPPYRPTTSSRASERQNTPPTPTRQAAMSIDPPRSPTPDPEFELDVNFTTVDEHLDEDASSSAFKELLDWMRYLAQHAEQRERLHDLLGVARDSLRDLMGPGEDPGHAATYAHVAASATQQSKPRRAQTSSGSRTAKPARRHIQHAITRFERVSRELPGAPKDTLLNIVARSDLRTAPPPLPAAPQPRKRPSCLVKGIRANTVAVRLPEQASTPPSFPAVISAVNGLLIKAKRSAHIKEILPGVRRHITIVFDTTVDYDTSSQAIREVLVHFKTRVGEDEAKVLERPTHSLLKFTAVPTVTPDGRPVTAEMAATCLTRHPEWKKATPLEPPRFVFPKTNPDPLHATLLVKIKDTLKASVATKLLETSVSFVGAIRRCQPWTSSPTSRQCSTCLKWGHTAFVCRARAPACDQCAGPHTTALHRQHAVSCKDTACSHFNIHCVNCAGQHHASSVACSFFRNRSSPSELQKLQKARVERLRRQS
jgi:hypothetical protein